MMDCLEAQRIVSERLDGEGIDSAVLEEAKNHCRSCSECSAFVKTLATLRVMPLPQPPETLVGNVMDAVRAEHALAQGASSTRLAEAATQVGAEATQPRRTLVATLRDPHHRQAVAAWAAAAAVVVVIAGIGAVAGVRQILAPDAGVRSYEVESAAPGVTEKEFGPEAAAPQDSAAAGLAAQAAPSYITVGTSVYLAEGQASSVESASLTAVGTTTSSLGGTRVMQHEVLGAGDPATVYIITSDQGVLAFSRVTREFGGRTYGFSGGPITEYGKWPALPPGFTVPTSPDGSPEFVAAGTDSQGAQVFKRRGGTTADGIALPPGSAPDDPAAGNPNWTWWVPFAQ